jgi:hypothetical protein
MRKIAADAARKRREALHAQRAQLQAAASAEAQDGQQQPCSGSRSSEGCSIMSPALGRKAQAAMDSARDVVRRVLVNKVCRASRCRSRRKRCNAYLRMRASSSQQRR